jgi:hypothetical protein
VVVAPKPTVSGDVDVTRMRDRFVFAWTDRTGTDPEVTIAQVGEDGSVQPPKKALASVGGSALVGLVAGPAGALLAWDAPNRRGRPSRRVYLAHIDPLGELDGRTSAVDVVGRGAPELAATDTGFAFLGTTRAGNAAQAAPTFVRFDASLGPLQTEPLLLGEDRIPAQLAWGLTCVGDRCAALTANGDRVHSVDIAARAGTTPAPVPPPLPEDAPRLGVSTTLAQGEPFADVSVAKVDGGTLVAILGTTLEGAQLSVRALDAKGAPSGAASPISSRALAIGGVSIAAGSTPEDGAAIAWVARDAGDPQVHVTRVDKRGKRQNDVMLTTAKGDAADVAIAWADGGWIVAWVDGRDGNGEVYATKVDRGLSRIAREERITNAAGDASDVALLARGDLVSLAWADPRESPTDGFADVYVTQLKAHDAKRAGPEQRVLASAAHSRSPALAATTDGVVIGWIEEAPMGADAATSAAHGAMLARLDDRGKPRGAPIRVRGAGDGFPTTIALEAEGNGTASVRGVIARAEKEQLDVDAIELPAREDAVRAWPFLTLDGPPSLDVSLQVLGGRLYYNDDGPEPGDRRVRRVTMLWK